MARPQPPPSTVLDPRSTKSKMMTELLKSNVRAVLGLRHPIQTL
jgi:hypothetical protein